MSPSFQQSLEALYGLERRKTRLGLEGTRALLGALGDPHTRFRSIHVAGTNGKGTTCALVERVLREAGIRTGLFTSPHLVDFRERIRVAGRWVDEEWLERSLERIRVLPEGKDCTFFEVVTALGFLWFAEQGVEWAVVEVGLGGRLDCTNVLQPDLAVITTIAFDHTEILGDTLERIATEKAGIVKPGVPLVTGVTAGRAAEVIEAVAAERGAPIVRQAFDNEGLLPADGEPRRDLRWFLVGSPWGDRVELPKARVQPSLRLNENLALVALAALTERGLPLTWRAVARGLAQTRWPGRFERCPRESRLWWDGAHNAAGARVLSRLWTRAHGRALPGALVLAQSRDKDVDAFLEALRWGFPGARLVATRSRSERALDPERMAERARSIGFDAETAPDVTAAVRRALAAAGQAPVLLTGSLFAVGEAMETFGGAPGAIL